MTSLSDFCILYPSVINAPVRRFGYDMVLLVQLTLLLCYYKHKRPLKLPRQYLGTSLFFCSPLSYQSDNYIGLQNSNRLYISVGMHLLLLTLTLALLLYPIHPATLTVNPAGTTIAQSVQYSFQINLASAGITPGLATLTFDPAVYSFTNTTAITGCFNTLSVTTLYSCYASATNKISFRWTTAMSATSPLFLSISSITNPAYVDNFTVSFDFAPDSNATFGTVTSTITGLQPDTLTSCAMSFNPNYTNTLSTITFTVVNKHQIPSGGSLQLTFNGYTPTSSSLTISAASASINTGVVAVVTGSVFSFSGFFSSLVAAGSTLTFSIGSIMSPPTTASSLYSITILTSATTSYLNKIDQSTCTITNIINFPTASLSFVPSSTMKVGDTGILLYANFLAPTAINFSTDSIVVSVDAGSASYYTVYYRLITVTTNVTGIGMVGVNSTLGVTFPTTAVSQTIASGTAVQINSGLFAASSVNSGSKTLVISFSRSGNSYSSNTATVTISPNVLTAASLSVLSSTVSTATTYNFTMTITNPLGIGAGVKITMPSTISIATGSCQVTVTLSVVNALSSVVSCTASTAQIISVTNISNAILPTGTIITLAVQNINNPTTTKTISSLFYQTYYSLTELVNPVDDSTGFDLSFTPAPVTIPSANFLAARASTTNRAENLYTFTYTVYTTFPANGYIIVNMPAAMVLSAGATAHYTLSTNSTNTTISMTSSTTTAKTAVTLNFNGLITSTLTAGTIFTITISNIRNYYSYKPVNLQMISYTSDNFAIEQSDSAAVTLTNTVTDSNLLVGASNGVTTNGNTQAYSFALTSPVALASTDSISIELSTTNNVNTQLLYSTTPTCVVNGTTATCSKDISNTKLLTMVAASALAANTAATITVSSIVLTRSKDTPGSIIFRTYEVSGGVSYLISTFTLTPPANNNTNLITAASLTIIDNGISSPRLNQPTRFTLSVNPSNTLITGDYIVVTVPAEWSNTQSSMVTVNVSGIATQTGSLCTDSTVFCSNHLSDSHKIRIDDKTGSAFPSVTNLSFTIASTTFASPKTWLSSYSTFSFSTFSNTSAAIDASTASTTNTAAFSLACPNSTTFHCKTCNSTGFCSACYQTGDGVDTTFNFGGFAVRQSTGECVSSCGANYFNQSNFCVQCTSPCYGCLDATTTSCTSCIAPTVLNNSQCLSACPTGYYNNSGVCAICTSPCSACSLSATNCTACINTTYLNGNTCGSNCTGVSGTFADNSTWTCAACIVNCSSCSNSSSNCTACASTYFMSGGVCTQNCPTGTAKENSTSCTCNFTVCATCVLTINTCLTCTTGLVLLNSTCLSSCGTGYYNSSNTCIACVSNCNTCSASGCSVCATAAPILYNNSCVSVCPTGTTQSGSTCITCITGCSVCSSTTICTSCLSIYYLVIYNNGSTECTRPCPSSFPLLENSICVASCTAPLVADSTGTSCVTASTTTNGTTTTTTTLVSSTSRVVPFPVTIALVVMIIATLASKVALPDTIIPAALCAFAGVAEIISWFVFIISTVVDSNSASLGQMGLIIVVVAYVITLVLNVIAIVFFKKYLFTDDKFQNHFKRLTNKTRCGVSVTYFVLVLASAFSHKIIQLLFSNLFQTNYFLYKVTQVNKFTPINYVRYCSIVATVVAIVGAGMANYEVQTLTLGSLVFVQSIDLIIVTILAAIAGIWATVKNPDHYQQQVEKKNDMEEELEHEPIEDDLNQFQKQDNSGIKRKHVMTSSHRNNYANDKNDPLNRVRVRGKNPLGEEYNVTTNPLHNQEDGVDRIDIGDMDRPELVFKRKASSNGGLLVQDIGFVDESGDSLLPRKETKEQKTRGRSKSPEGKGKRGRSVSPGKKSKRQLSEQQQKLKDSIEGKLNHEERQKAKVIGQVDSINTVILLPDGQNIADSETALQDKPPKEAKKQKLQRLSAAPEENLEKLTETERGKAEQIKQAMGILSAKKITIGDYLDYLDIIEEENEDGASEDYNQNKKLSNKIGKGKYPKKKGNKNTLGRSLRKMDRQDRSARYQMDKNLVVNHIDDSDPGMFDQELEPTPANFHETPNRARNQSQGNGPNDIQDFRYSGSKQIGNNRSQQTFKKNKPNINDMVVVSLESGDNDDPGMSQQFQRGNTLKQNQRDQVPPSNMYSTERVIQKSGSSNNARASINSFPFNKETVLSDKIVKNRLIGQDDNIEFIESEGGDHQSLEGQLMAFNNDISPSHFDEPNLRIQNDEGSNAPSKPKVLKKAQPYDNNDVLQIEDLQEMQDYDEFQHGGYRKDSPINRYQSNKHLDYDDILHQKRNQQKMKKLEEIYLPRQEVPRAPPRPKKRVNHSTTSRYEEK